jgi:citrate lyase subunit beta / citryl-CoA lyase
MSDGWPIRTQLAVPGSSERMVAQALASDADRVFLDLEDAVAPDAKGAARGPVAAALRDGEWRGRPPAYRINAVDTPHFVHDLVDVMEASGGAARWIIVPKVRGEADVHAVDAVLTALEASLGIEPGGVRLEAQIETASGLAQVEAIAGASPRLACLNFGPGDFAADMGMPSDAIGVSDAHDAAYPGHRLHYPMLRVVTAARAHRLLVTDGPIADVRDEAALHASASVARALGFDGKWVIHPAQIATVNAVFTPSADEIAHARRVVEAYQAAMARGEGAIALDGRLIDAASLRMARRTLDRGGRTVTGE